MSGRRRERSGLARRHLEQAGPGCRSPTGSPCRVPQLARRRPAPRWFRSARGTAAISRGRSRIRSQSLRPTERRGRRELSLAAGIKEDTRLPSSSSAFSMAHGPPAPSTVQPSEPCVPPPSSKTMDPFTPKPATLHWRVNQGPIVLAPPAHMWTTTPFGSLAGRSGRAAGFRSPPGPRWR